MPLLDHLNPTTNPSSSDSFITALPPPPPHAPSPSPPKHFGLNYLKSLKNLCSSFFGCKSHLSACENLEKEAELGGEGNVERRREIKYSAELRPLQLLLLLLLLFIYLF